MREALADTEELFMLVIVGEFNAGKSAFTNALLGEALSPEGITPTTDEVLILKYGAQASERRRQEGVLEKAFPNDVLREVSVVDTPGTNAVIRHHEELSRAFVPRSDLVLFVTSAQRPFTESERAYLEVIRDWGKKIVFVMNNSDVLGGVTTNITRQFVREQATKLIGSEPPVFMVSAKLAQEAKQVSESLTRRALVYASGFASLEQHLRYVLEDQESLALKLSNPLGVIERLPNHRQAAALEREKLLIGDRDMCRDVELRLEVYEQDMREDFGSRMHKLLSVIGNIDRRADEWFEKNIQITNAVELLRREKIQERFRDEVVADLGTAIEAGVEELVDWTVDRNQKQWRSMERYIALRQKTTQEAGISPELDDGFERARENLRESVGEYASGVVSAHDPRLEAEKLALSLRSAITRTAATEIGALGLGTAVGALATSAVLGMSGVIAALIIARVGMSIIPKNRRIAREDFRAQTNLLREQLSEATRRQFDAESSSAVDRMRAALLPYREFVDSELVRAHKAEVFFAKTLETTASLKNDIQTLTPNATLPASPETAKLPLN